VSKGKAKARAAAVPQRRPKTTRAVSGKTPQPQTPTFSFRHSDRGTTATWKFAPEGEHASELVQFMCEMSRLTWAEIERQQTGGKDRHRKHHSQEISTLAPDAQRDIARTKLDEIFGDAMFRFRLSGERRLWGFRTGRIFHAVWWDPEHDVYKTEKR
jgi:hypothetical protein